MNLSISITRRERRRKLRGGETVINVRFVLNYRDPRTNHRHQLFFERRTDAVAKRDNLVANYQAGTLVRSAQARSATVADVVARWLANREGQVSARTMIGYKVGAKYITHSLLRGTQKQRYHYTLKGTKPVDAEFLPTLGHIPFAELSTAQIRDWHKTLSTEVGAYTANRAKMFLKAALSLAAEDFETRPPVMPSNLGRARRKAKKAVLTTEQVAVVLAAAKEDQERGIYYAFPFLAGTRPSEQLGLLWKEVDFEANVIRICRSQDKDGELLEATKTDAGTREIPMCSLLRQMLLEWRVRCPRVAGELHRVFPGLGHMQAWPKPRTGGGGALLYPNFRKRFWISPLKKLGLEHVTPHSARHLFISVLQMQGVEVGLVAKLAGHSNANVTLGHYTQAVRGGSAAVAALEQAYGAAAPGSPASTM